MLLQIFQPLRAKLQPWKCESLSMGCPSQPILPLIPELEEEHESSLPTADRLLMKEYEIIAAPSYLTFCTGFIFVLFYNFLNTLPCFYVYEIATVFFF